MNLTNSNLSITMTGNSSSDNNHQNLSDFFRPLNMSLCQGPATPKKEPLPVKPRTIRFADEKAEAALLLESILLFEPDEYFDDPSVMESVLHDFHDSGTSMSSFDSWEYAHGGNCPQSGVMIGGSRLSWRDIEQQVREQQAKEFQRQQLLGPLFEPDDDEEEEGSEGDDKATQMVPFEIKLQVSSSTNEPPVSPMPASPFNGGGKKKLSTSSLLTSMVSPLVSPKPQLTNLYASSPVLTSPRRRTLPKDKNPNLQMALSRSETLQCLEDAAQARKLREDKLDQERAQKAAQTAREKREKEQADRQWRQASRKGSAVQQRMASFENNNSAKPSLFTGSNTNTKRPVLRRNKTDSEKSNPKTSNKPSVQRSKTYKEDRRSSLPTLTLLWPPEQEQEEQAKTTRRHSMEAASPSCVLEELEDAAASSTSEPMIAAPKPKKKRNSILAKASLFEQQSSSSTRPSLQRSRTDSERLKANQNLKPVVQRSKTYQEKRSSLPTMTLLWPPSKEQEQEQEPQVQSKQPRRHSTETTTPSCSLLGDLEPPTSPPTTAAPTKPKKRDSIQAKFDQSSSLLNEDEAPSTKPTDSEANQKPVVQRNQEKRSSLPTMTLVWPPQEEEQESKQHITRRHSTETTPPSSSLLGELEVGEEEEAPPSPPTTAPKPKKRNSILDAMSMFEKHGSSTPSMFKESTTAPKSSSPSKQQRRRRSTFSMPQQCRRSVPQPSPMKPEVVNLFEPEQDETVEQPTMDSSEVVHLFEAEKEKEESTSAQEEEEEQRKRSVLRLQCVLRGWLVRQRVRVQSTAQKEEQRERSVLRLQCVLRGWLVRRVVRAVQGNTAQQNAQAAQKERYQEVQAAQEASIVENNAWNRRERSAIQLQAMVRGWLVRRVVQAAETRLRELRERLKAIRAQAVETVQSEYGPELEALKEEHRAIQQANASYQRRIEIEEQKVVIRRDIALVKDQNEKIAHGMEQLEAHNRAIAKSTKDIEHRSSVVEKRIASLQKTNDRLCPQREQLQARVRNVEQEIHATTVQTNTEREVGRICRTTILRVRNAAKAVAKDSDCSFLKKVEMRAKILDRIHNKQVAMETASQQEHMQALGACPLLLSR